MFVSLVVIYLVAKSPLVSVISVLIMTISLVATLYDRWRQIAAIALLATLVSLIAAHLLGNARYGNVGGVLVPMLWCLVLFLMFVWFQRNLLPVPTDRAILVRNVYTSNVKILTPPVAPPLLPFIEQRIAVIPLYTLSADTSVDKINTKAGYNIDSVKIHTHFRVADRATANLVMHSLTNRGHALQDRAKAMHQELEVARTELVFWERVIIEQLEDALDDATRDVIFEEAQNPVDAYTRRAELAQMIQERLAQRVNEWGIRIAALDIDRMDVDAERFKAANKEKSRRTEREDAQAKAEREAMRNKITREAEAAAEAERIARIVSALHTSGVNLSPEVIEEIVINAIRASAEWDLESSYGRYPAEPPPASARDKSK
jgi:regulator of protease activity HflC (stomatin/prohibitin superfamily)